MELAHAKIQKLLACMHVKCTFAFKINYTGNNEYKAETEMGL